MGIDSLIKDILKEMGVDESKPPQWIPHYYDSKGKPPMGGKRQDGWLCSYCGKHSYIRKKTCDGCNSIMENSKERGDEQCLK